MGYPATTLKAPLLQQREAIILDVMLNNPAAASGLAPVIDPMLGYPIYAGKSASEFTQAIIDSFLGSVNEFAVTTAFGSTALGTDAVGFVINMQGQAASAVWCCSELYIGAGAANATTGFAGQGTVTTVLANTLTQGLAVTSLGNIYGRVIPTGSDANAVPLRLRVAVYLK